MDTAIQSILESDARIKVVSSKVINTELIEETTDMYVLERDRERVHIAIIIGDRKSQVGPYEGEYWISIAGEPEGIFKWGIFKCNEPFARDLTNILLALGARENRRRTTEGIKGPNPIKGVRPE